MCLHNYSKFKFNYTSEFTHHMQFYYLYIAATVNIEAIESPPGEGDGVGIAALLRLLIEPTTSILSDDVAVSVAVKTGGSITAFGEMCVE